MGCVATVPRKINLQPNIDDQNDSHANKNLHSIVIHNDNIHLHKNNIDLLNNDIRLPQNNILIHNDNNENCHPVNSNFEYDQNAAEQQVNIKHDKKTLLFIKKYKLESLSLFIYNEGVTVDFLLSQNTNDISLIAKKLIENNIIQQKKFIYAVKTEKQSIKNKLAKSNKIKNVKVPKRQIKSIHKVKEIKENDTFRIHITNPYNDKDSLPLIVRSSDTISNVLYTFQTKYKNLSFFNLPLDKLSDDTIQILTYCGTEMMHNKNLGYYNVMPASELYLSYKFIRQRNINRSNSSKSHKKRKKPKKKKKKRPTSAKSKSFSFSYTDTCVSIRSNTYSNQYQEGLELVYGKKKEKINVFINHKRFVMKLGLYGHTKIKKLKHKIAKKWGVATKNQKLTYNGVELADLNYIYDYSIEDKCNICMTKKMGLYSVEINICYKNKLISMDFDKYDTVKCIKMQIQLYLKIQCKRQRLIYLNEELLNDNATIKSVNICDGMLVYLQSN